MLEFKHDDNNTPLKRCLPDVVHNSVTRYEHLGLKALCDEMVNYMHTSQMDKRQRPAYLANSRCR